MLTVVVDRDDPVVVVRLRGEMDLGSTGRAKESLDAVVADQPPAIVVDLVELEFIDSSGIRALLAAAKAAEAHGTAFTIRAPRPSVRRVLEIAGVGDLVIEDRS